MSKIIFSRRSLGFPTNIQVIKSADYCAQIVKFIIWNDKEHYAHTYSDKYFYYSKNLLLPYTGEHFENLWISNANFLEGKITDPLKLSFHKKRLTEYLWGI